MSATERQKHLSRSLYLYRVRLLRPHHDPEKPNEKCIHEEFHVAPHIDDIWEIIAAERADEGTEVESISREVPVLSVVEPKPLEPDDD